MKPIKVDAVDKAFGGNIKNLLPPWNSIPEEFKNHRNTKWNEIVCRWFFRGLPNGTEFIPREGIDAKMAIDHLVCILRSFEPKHEHKEAGVAYLMSEWFQDVQIPEQKESTTN